MKRYLKIWWMMTLAATQNNFASRFGAVFLMLGKIIRFLFFFFFLIVIGTKTKVIASYTLQQMIFFFLTYQLVDTIPQFLMRMVYRFRGQIVSGDFDYYLTKPFSPLFRALFGWTDALDIPMIIVSIAFLIPSVLALGNVTITGVISYICLILNAFFIALSFHIMILSLGVLTTEIDNATMFYRDLTQMGRVPVDIYKEPLKGLITFVIPVGIMMTVPAKALMGLVNIQILPIAILFGIWLFTASLFLWQFALREYSSASS